MVKTKAKKVKAATKVPKKAPKGFIVEVESFLDDGWYQSRNIGANGVFDTLAEAKKVAAKQHKQSVIPLKYRARAL